MSIATTTTSSVASEASYDEVPYPGGPFPMTHPCHLAMVGRLCGLTPPLPGRSRVLELGCSIGSNIIPMAQALPDSDFVGIDLSAAQIEEGRSLLSEAGLKNIELRHLSITDVDESLGNFDYIICHGVYSWVSHEVQRKILEIGRKQLSSNGIMYVSYNTYPGWRMRGLVRDMMLYHVADFETPQQKIGQARGLLDFLVKYAKSHSKAYPSVLKDEAEMLKDSVDSYIYHDHLEKINEPVYFYEFINRMNDAGLRYLADASVATMLAQRFDAEAAEILREAPLLRREQYMDFLRSRMFRSSLLCHPTVQPDYRLAGRDLLRLHVALRAPMSSTRSVNGEVIWRSGEGKLTTSQPITGAIEQLNRRFPGWVPVAQLVDNLSQDTERQQVLDALLMGFVESVFQLAADPIEVCTEVTGRPRVTPLARVQARRGNKITSLRHVDWVVQPQQRFLIENLDGSRSISDLAELLHTAVKSGRFRVTREGAAVAPDLDESQRIVKAELEFLRSLSMLTG